MGNLNLRLDEGCSLMLEDVSYSLEYGVSGVYRSFLIDCLFVDPPLFVLLVAVHVCKCVSSWLSGALGD